MPALKALSGLLTNHSPALFGGDDASAGGAASSRRNSAPAPAVAAGGEGAPAAVAAGAPAGTGGGGGGGTAGVIARGVFEELHLPALSQSIRQVIGGGGRRDGV